MTVQSSSPTPPSIRLLLIEDDLGDAMLVRYALKNAGSRFHLTHTASLKEAAAWLESNVCDVILLDLSLPDSFGLATITKIRALAPHVPVIVLTGHADEDFACNAVEAGTQDYLVKGQTEGDVLARAIRYALLRKQMEDRLRASEEKLKAIIELACDAIIVIDEHQHIVLFNPAAERMFGWTQAEVLGESLAMLLPGTTHEVHDTHFLSFACSAGRSRPMGQQSPVQGCRRNGESFPVEVGISKVPSPEGTLYTAIVRDISERMRIERELRLMATTDALTGLANRRHFMEVATTELSRVKRYGGALSVLLLDVDFFKKINDTYGHAAGDEALRALSMECCRAARETDVIGRLGGEEFAFLLPETADTGAIEFAERLRQRLAGITLVLAECTFSFTVSIGVATFRAGDETIDQMLSRADTALYSAKAAGRNRVAA